MWKVLSGLGSLMRKSRDRERVLGGWMEWNTEQLRYYPTISKASIQIEAVNFGNCV